MLSLHIVRWAKSGAVEIGTVSKTGKENSQLKYDVAIKLRTADNIETHGATS